MENPRPRRPLESLERPEGERQAARQGSNGRSRWVKVLLGLGVLGGVLVAGMVLWLPSHEDDVPTPMDLVRAQERRELGEIFQRAKTQIRAF